MTIYGQWSYQVIEKLKIFHFCALKWTFASPLATEWWDIKVMIFLWFFKMHKKLYATVLPCLQWRKSLMKYQETAFDDTLTVCVYLLKEAYQLMPLSTFRISHWRISVIKGPVKGWSFLHFSLNVHKSHRFLTYL